MLVAAMRRDCRKDVRWRTAWALIEGWSRTRPTSRRRPKECRLIRPILNNEVIPLHVRTAAKITPLRHQPHLRGRGASGISTRCGCAYPMVVPFPMREPPFTSPKQNPRGNPVPAVRIFGLFGLGDHVSLVSGTVLVPENVHLQQDTAWAQALC